MLTVHTELDWDDAKAAENLRKHGVDFEEDVAPALLYPLGEPLYLEDFDRDHSDFEDR